MLLGGTMEKLVSIDTRALEIIQNVQYWPYSVLETSRPYVAFLTNIGYQPDAKMLFKAIKEDGGVSYVEDQEFNKAPVLGLLETKDDLPTTVSWLALFQREG